MTQAPHPAGGAVEAGEAISPEQIEAAAEAGYASSAWAHRRPWSQNPWARPRWRQCAAEMLAAAQAARALNPTSKE